MNRPRLYEPMDMPDPGLPVKISEYSANRPRKMFTSHWHEHMELLFITGGKGIIECSKVQYEVESGDLMVINSNELHKGESTSVGFSYYCIIINISQLMDSINTTGPNTYTYQIIRNLVLFKNKISSSPAVELVIKNIINEYKEKKDGFELEIISEIYRLLVILLRNHIKKVLSEKEYDLKARNMERFGKIFKYIETNYKEKITVQQCAQILNITVSHFCHLFKLITGKSLSSYVNILRLQKAGTLLQNTSLNITEVALATGFNDIPYFTKLFKTYTGVTPSEYRKSNIDG